MAIPFLNNLDLNLNEIQNAKLQQLATDPSGSKLVQGLFWMNTASVPPVIKYYNGTEIITVGAVNFETNPSNIQMDGTASVGTLDTIPRADHVHPSDTSRVAANAPITAGTYPKITYDEKGLVTGGAALDASDIPDISATYVPMTSVGQANGVAGLDETGKVPAAQLPSYVDDVVDAYIVGDTPFAEDWLSLTSGGAPLTPSTSVIYVIVSPGDYVNSTFRWTGTQYAEVSPSVVYTQGNGIEISTSNVISLVLQTAQANGLTLTAEGLSLALASASTAGAMSSADFTKLQGIAEGATNVQQSETNGNIIINGEEVTVYTPSSGAANKYTENNPQLTSSGGLCTWTVTHGLNTSAVVVSVAMAASPFSVVIPEVDITNANTVTISIVSSSTINAGTYTVTVVG